MMRQDINDKLTQDLETLETFELLIDRTCSIINRDVIDKKARTAILAMQDLLCECAGALLDDWLAQSSR